MNKISIQLLTLLLFAILSQSLAQNAISITGKIVDEKNGTPLSYATISLKGTGMGTVSNSDGEFEFHIPLLYSKDTLQISMLGYAVSEIALSSIETGKPSLFKLKESI